MKRYAVLASALLAFAAGSAGAQNIWTDNFDSYADQAAFNSVWATSATAMTLDTDGTPTPVSSPNTIAQGTAAQQSRRAFTSVAPTDIDFSFSFYDEMGTGSLARTYGMIYARGGAGGWGDALQQLVAVGKYNSVSSPKYFARVAFSSSNWFVLAAGPDRSVGWHTARVLGNAGTSSFDFYIDNILSGSAPIGVPTATFNWVVMGSGLSSTHGMNFDDVSIGKIVPEPGSLLALGAGLFGFTGLMFRRRS